MVVGSQARILYSDQVGRARLAVAFNEAVADGRLTGPVVISRDHHDVSGTDSPFRETSNIKDGSAFTAGQCHQCPYLSDNDFKVEIEMLVNVIAVSAATMVHSCLLLSL